MSISYSFFMKAPSRNGKSLLTFLPTKAIYPLTVDHVCQYRQKHLERDYWGRQELERVQLELILNDKLSIVFP